MGDAIANHYSQSHQNGGYYKKMGMKSGHAIPLKNQEQGSYLERSTGKDATVASKDYSKLASQARTAQKCKKRKYSTSTSESDDEIERKRSINKKNEKKQKKKKSKYSAKKHKRNRIDDALGSDTY